MSGQTVLSFELLLTYLTGILSSFGVCFQMSVHATPEEELFTTTFTLKIWVIVFVAVLLICMHKPEHFETLATLISPFPVLCHVMQCKEFPCRSPMITSGFWTEKASSLLNYDSANYSGGWTHLAKTSHSASWFWVFSWSRPFTDWSRHKR